MIVLIYMLNLNLLIRALSLIQLG